METLKVMLTDLQSFLLDLMKGFLVLLPCILAYVYKTAVAAYFSSVEMAPSQRENRPSSLLVPVPFHFRVDSTKEKIPVLKFGEILRRVGSSPHDDRDQDDNRSCAVCLTCMKEYDEVREIQSCFHVFHRECLDAWIDKGKVSCPLCRSNMLSKDQKFNCLEDQWRKERMIYLFGDDIIF